MPVSDGTVLKAVATIYMPESVIAQNVFFVKLNTVDPWADTTLGAQIANYVDAVYANILADMDSGCSLGDVDIHEWEWDGVLDKWVTGRFVDLAALTGAPAAAGDMSPHACAAVVTGFAEAVNTRSRKSFPGFGEAKNTESNWVAGTITNLVGAAADWISLYALGGTQSLEAVIPNKYGVAVPIIASLVSSIVGSQRQRKPGEGI